MQNSGYLFTLFIDDVPFEVQPIWSDEMKLEIKKEDGQAFFREKLSESFVFVRENFDLINNASFDARFRLYIAEESDPDGLFWQGTFYKTDCKNWDLDARYLEVQPEPLDNYQGVVSGKDKKFNLVDLAPERETVRYKKQPVVQVYLPGSAFLMNYLDGTWWEQPVIEPITDTVIQLPALHFGFDSIPNTVKTFIPGDGLVPDVSGAYIQDGNGNTEHVDGTYGLVYQDIGNGGPQWTILDRNNGDAVVYTGPVNDQLLLPDPSHYEQGTLLSSLSSGSQCRVFASEAYGRYLTDELEVNGVPTNEVPENDITSDSFGFTRVLPLQINEVIPFAGNSDDPTPFGRFSEGATNLSGQYFTAPVAPNGERVYPLMRTEWTEVSWWFYYTPELRDLQEDGAQDILLRHAYPLASCLKVLLREIAPGVIYNETEVHSQFLNAVTNPVTGEKNKRIFITPKTNIKVGEYDLPAKSSEVSFQELEDFMRTAYDLYWHIQEDGKLVIEHLSWYEKGGSYTTPVVSSDLTTFVEPKTEKRWDYLNRKFDYDKETTPERVDFAWMDETTLPFDGYNIEILSPFVQKGNISDRAARKFTTDISFVTVQPGSIADKGFVAMACEEQAGTGLWFVPFLEITANQQEYKLQNGFLSFVYLHPRFHRHSMPAAEVVINAEASSAITVKRIKRQRITFPFPGLDPIQLIKTNLGEGLGDSYSVTLVSKSTDAEILHNE